MNRRVASFLVLSAVLIPARAQIVITLPAPSVYIQVGSLGGTIDTVTFPLGATPLGTAVPQLEAAVHIEVAYRRGGGATPAQAIVTMTPSPAAGLQDVSATYFVPWTQFDWSSSAPGQLPNGTFTGVANQVLTSFNVPRNRTRFRIADFTFQYLNTITVPVGGTYTGRVTYTVTTP